MKYKFCIYNNRFYEIEPTDPQTLNNPLVYIYTKAKSIDGYITIGKVSCERRKIQWIDHKEYGFETREQAKRINPEWFF